MININKLAVTFNREAIDKQFDFFLIKTNEKFIPRGSYVLDKPIQSFKARSLVFENGRSAFVMFKKNAISEHEFANTIEDETILIQQIYTNEIKDYILARLFLYSLNNYETEEASFNNITGKLYLLCPEWIKAKKGFKCLNIDINKDFCISANACSFNKLSLFKDKKVQGKDYPKYSLEGKNYSLKRELRYDNKDEVFVKKALFGKKCEIPFFTLKPADIKRTKIYFIYKTVELLNNKYNDCLTASFCQINRDKSIEKYKDENFMVRANAVVSNMGINFVNYVTDECYRSEFESMVNAFKERYPGKVAISDNVNKNVLNIAFAHNEAYYIETKQEDPHKSIQPDIVTQFVTVEDSVEKIIKDNEAIINTVIKELCIKNDIINNKTITLDNWDLKSDVIIGKEREDAQYYIIVHPNGSIEFESKKNDFYKFSDARLNKLNNILLETSKSEKLILMYGENIGIIEKTEMFAMPSKDLLFMDTISRSKESREKYLLGVTDVNLLSMGDGHYFNAGLKGHGMNTPIPKAAAIYKIEYIHGAKFFEEMLETMSVSFVKYNQYTVLPYPVKYLNEYILLNARD